MSVFEHMEAEQMEAELVSFKQRRNNLEEELRDVNESIGAIKEEFNRRAIAAYWAANPHITELSTGDKVMVTDEYNAFYERDTRQRSRYDAGEIVTIGYIGVENGKPGYFMTEEFGGMTPYHVMLNMRRAYLAQQETTT